MSSNTNPHTGDKLQTKPGNDNFVNGFNVAFLREFKVGYLQDGKEKEITVFAESIPSARRKANDILKQHLDAFISYVR